MFSGYSQRDKKILAPSHTRLGLRSMEDYRGRFVRSPSDKRRASARVAVRHRQNAILKELHFVLM